MSQKPMSELRRRMLEDMAVRKFSETTCRNYIRHIAEFAKFLSRSPNAATAEDVRRFQVHMSEIGARPSTLNTATSALHFFFGTTLDRPELARHLARVPEASTARAFPRGGRPSSRGGAGPGLKYKAALSIAYGAGLRAGEVVVLRVSDIDSKRMLIRVEHRRARDSGFARTLQVGNDRALHARRHEPVASRHQSARSANPARLTTGEATGIAARTFKCVA